MIGGNDRKCSLSLTTLVGLNGGQVQKGLAHAIQILSVESFHAELLPGLTCDVAGHECETLGMHLFGITEDDELLGPIRHGYQ